MSADFPTATILPPSTAMAAPRMTRRVGSTDCTFPPPFRRHSGAGASRNPESTLPYFTSGFRVRRCATPRNDGSLILPHVRQLIGDLQLDQHVLVGRILAQHGAVADALGDQQHVARMHDLDAHLGFPFERALDAEDDLVGVDVAMPEAHVVLAPLGDVD